MESELQIVQNLRQFMNKFHFIKNLDNCNTDEVDQLAKISNGQVVTFKSADSYASKIKASLKPK